VPKVKQKSDKKEKNYQGIPALRREGESGGSSAVSKARERLSPGLQNGRFFRLKGFRARRRLEGITESKRGLSLFRPGFVRFFGLRHVRKELFGEVVVFFEDHDFDFAQSVK